MVKNTFYSKKLFYFTFTLLLFLIKKTLINTIIKTRSIFTNYYYRYLSKSLTTFISINTNTYIQVRIYTHNTGTCTERNA